VHAHRAAEAAEMREVVARPAAGVEDAAVVGRAVRPLRGEEGQADGAHPRVPPLGLLRLVHAAVFFEVHSDSPLGLTCIASTSAWPPGVISRRSTLGPSRRSWTRALAAT